MKIFKDESYDQITSMKKGLPLLEKEIDEDKKKYLTEELSRCAHSIKGSSAIMGFSELAEMSAALEEVFKGAKEGKIEINASCRTILIQGIDSCASLLEKRKVLDYTNTIKGIRELINKNV